jgi:hypothetical protein
MILFYHIIQILHLADGDGRAVLRVIASLNLSQFVAA